MMLISMTPTCGSALHAAHERRVRRIAALREPQRAVAGIRLQHDARAAFPFAQAIGTGAHGPGANVAAGRLHHFAGDGAANQVVVDHRVVRLGQAQLQRVAVERAQSFDRPVVVELRARLACRIDHGPRAGHQIGHQCRSPSAQIGVEPALQRIHVVGGDELARLAPERGVVGEENAGRKADRPGLAAIGDRRRSRGRDGRQLWGRGKVIVFVQAFEDRREHLVRRIVGELLRIEGLDVDRRQAQDLVRVGGCCHGRGPDHDERLECQQARGEHGGPTLPARSPGRSA
jgi:hypothetical protein